MSKVSSPTTTSTATTDTSMSGAQGTMDGILAKQEAMTMMSMKFNAAMAQEQMLMSASSKIAGR